MQYPDILAFPAHPKKLEVFDREVMWAQGTFSRWPTLDLGPHRCDMFAGMNDTYGRKLVLLDPVRQEPVFAEQLILRALTAPGRPMTGGGWLDTFRCKFRDGGCRLETFVTFSPARQRQLASICATLRPMLARHSMKDSPRRLYCRGGWDVFCWHDPEDLSDALFIESKGPGDEFAEPPDYKEPMWLEAALNASAREGWGWTEANFRVLEWNVDSLMQR